MPNRKLESNPAQRLYDLLELHAEALPQHGNSGLWAVWKDVLQVSDEDFMSEFAMAFSLIPQIDQALHVTDDRIQRRSFQVHVESWRRAFVPDASGVGQGVSGGDVPEVARLALGAIASHLRDNVPEGLIPDGDRASDLRGEVASAIDALTQDESVPLPVRDLLLRRLHDILWAVDHISVMGAGGIATACDRLAMAVAWTSHQNTVKDKSFLSSFKDIIVHGYALVGVADTLAGGYQAWDAIEPYVMEGVKLLGS